MEAYRLDDLSHEDQLDPITDEVIDGRRVCTYHIDLPSDLCGFRSGDDPADEVELLGSEAINNVRDLASDYCMPASWEARLIKGDIRKGFEVTYEVKRYSNTL